MAKPVKEIRFIRQIRAEQQTGKPYDYWINVSDFPTLKEAKKSLDEYRDAYQNIRNVKENSRILKVITEVVVQ